MLVLYRTSFVYVQELRRERIVDETEIDSVVKKQKESVDNFVHKCITNAYSILSAAIEWKAFGETILNEKATNLKEIERLTEEINDLEAKYEEEKKIWCGGHAVNEIKKLRNELEILQRSSHELQQEYDSVREKMFTDERRIAYLQRSNKELIDKHITCVEDSAELEGKLLKCVKEKDELKDKLLKCEEENKELKEKLFKCQIDDISDDRPSGSGSGSGSGSCSGSGSAFVTEQSRVPKPSLSGQKKNEIGGEQTTAPTFSSRRERTVYGSESGKLFIIPYSGSGFSGSVMQTILEDADGGDNDIDRLFEWEVQRFICNEVIQHLVKSGDVNVHGCYQLLSHATGSVIQNARDRKQLPRTAEHISQYLKTNRTSIFETLEEIFFDGAIPSGVENRIG
ncbi:hypothetical protein OWV82_007518 [Melia azedarach]|uniref:Uncharacterized protein n=1 Tax=Melia azedarach TaxID=155640 RepID=A0ACC1Y767_MELAZ|nr:hypothetical protein OWV82_007518 [Melia azedarach]